MRLSLTSPDPLCTMNTSSPRTDSPISTLCVYIHNKSYDSSSLPSRRPSSFPLTTTHPLQFPSPPSLHEARLTKESCFVRLVGAFLPSLYHVSVLENLVSFTLPSSRPRREAMPRASSGLELPENTFMFGMAGKESGSAWPWDETSHQLHSRGTTSLRSKVTNEGLSDWKPEEFKGH